MPEVILPTTPPSSPVIRVEREYEYKLAIFIANKDKDNHNTEESSSITTTTIDTYEKSTLINTWYFEDGSTQIERIPIKDYTEYMVNDYANIDPIVITIDDNWENEVISHLNYLYSSGGNNDEKSVSIRFNTRDQYKHYELTETLFDVLIANNYQYIKINLEKGDFFIPNKQFSFKVLEITHTSIHFTDTIALTVEKFVMNYCKIYGNINSTKENGYASIGATVSREVEVTDCEIIDNIVTFSFLYTKDNVKNWKSSVCNISQLKFNINKEFKSLTDPIIRVVSFYSANIMTINCTMGDINGTILHFNEIFNLLVTDTHYTSNSRIFRSLITLDSVANSNICDSVVKQKYEYDNNKPPERFPYFVVYKSNDQLAEHKLVSCNVSSIGLASFSDCKARKFTSLDNTISHFKDPFKYNVSMIGKLIFFNNILEDVADLTLKANKLSLFDGDFEVNNVYLTVFEKLYINKTIMSSKDIIQIELFNDSSFITEKSLFKSNNMKINNDKDLTSRISCSDTRIEATNSIEIGNFDKFSFKTGKIKGRNVTIVADHITQFNGEINQDHLESLSITTTKIMNSVFGFNTIIGSNKSHSIEFVGCKGKVTILYFKNIPMKSKLTLNTTELALDYTRLSYENAGEVAISIYNDCKRSKITSIEKNLITFKPELVGEYQDLKLIRSSEDLEPKNSKDYVMYGNTE
jgi:hypothetical protein